MTDLPTTDEAPDARAPAAPPAAITAVDVTLAHGTNVVLAGASLTIGLGTHTSVIGPNGSGKSTFLRAVAGLLPVRAGRLDVPAARRRGGVAVVFQSPAVDTSLPVTVREVVSMGRYPHRGPIRPLTAADRRIVADACERMEVGDLVRHPLDALSGGQRQRVMVAQALAQEADLLLLDEPATALDLPSQALVDAAIAAEVEAGRTVVSSTHDLADAGRADVVVLLAGRIVAVGPPEVALADGPLREAYGERMVTLDGGAVLLDDPHHGH